jgi:hypothetical protein
MWPSSVAVRDLVLPKRPGLAELIVMLYLDREKLSERQRERFFGCLASSFGHLADEDLAFVIGDFIARVAPPEDSLELLFDMTAKATARQALAGVFLGRDILEKSIARRTGTRSMPSSQPGMRRKSELNNWRKTTNLVWSHLS